MTEPVSIIILNYNGKKYLKDCLTSVLAQSYPHFEVLLFDNNSLDGSVEFVKETFMDKRLNIIVSKNNLGFANGNNETLMHTKFDLTVLLNNDTIVEKDWLRNLANAAQERNIVASSYVITEGIDPKYYETNGSVSYLMYNVMNIFENIEDEFYPNGCSLIFRKSEIPQPFDNDYFFYSEDLYLGLKSRFMGMKIKFVKESVAHHFGGGTVARSVLKTFFQERNRLLNLYIFFSSPFIVKISPIIFLTNSVKLLTSLFSHKTSFFGLLKAHIWFYFHIPLIKRKRIAIEQIKKIDEKEVIRLMTSRLLNNESALARIINNTVYYYSRFMGIKPIEYFQKNKD